MFIALLVGAMGREMTQIKLLTSRVPNQIERSDPNK